MSPTQEPLVTRFSRIKVKDLESFRAIHAEAMEAQRSYGIAERVFQSADNPNDLTIQITGPGRAVQEWLDSPQRAELSNKLQIDGTPESWLATEFVGFNE